MILIFTQQLERFYHIYHIFLDEGFVVCDLPRRPRVPVLPVVHGRQQPERGDEPVRFLHRGAELFVQLTKPGRTQAHAREKGQTEVFFFFLISSIHSQNL